MKRLPKFFLALLVSFFVFFSLAPTVVHAQQNDLKAEIDSFLNQGATHYLIWQFTVDPHDGDDYSFYQGDALVCSGLKEAAAAHPGQVGVNSWALGKQSPGTIDQALAYLSNECGVSILRIWGTVGDPVSVVRAAANHNIQVIVTLGDYSNGSPGLPSFGTSDPTSWYESAYQGEYRQNAQNIVRSIASAGLSSNVYAYELANEAHCSGYVTCLTPYNNWARSMALTVKAIAPGVKVGIGQMADHDTTRGDSPGPGDFVTSNSSASIDVASAHYYSADERAKAIESMGKSPKPFYIGEAPTQVSGKSEGSGTPVVISSKPIPDPYVACNDVRPIPGSENEFHSLRPYQASPCVQKVVDTIMYCGNNFYAKETFEVTPDDFASCQSDSNGNLTCFDLPSFSSQIQADIELDKADLPILGNTQLVPNTVNTVDELDSATRMNNYVSWYLNGAIYRAEDSVPALSDILQFAGPIRKLLPESVQAFLREDQILQAGVTRHDQVVTKSGTRISQASENSDYVPFSSTEDRVGEVTAENKFEEGGFGGDTFTVRNVVFTPSENNLQRRDDIYFAHTEESVGLAKAIQSTFASVANPGASDQDNFNPDFKNIPARVKGFCDIKKYETNPGDDLFGDYNNADSPDYSYKEKISGVFSYRTDAYHGPVTFSPSRKVDDTCIANGGTPDACTYFYYAPRKRYAYVALYVYTKSPKIKEIWDRLVNGNESVVGRFFPKDLKIDDIPAAVSAVYNTSLTSGSRGSGTEAIAGTPFKPKDGEEALLFIPHLGSVKDYFLEGIQCALRPQGMCGNADLQQPATTSLVNACTIDGSGIISQKLQGIIANAANWSHVPISVLTMVVKNEAACPGNAAGTENFDPNTTPICTLSDSQIATYLGTNPQTYPRNCNFSSTDQTHSRGPLQFQPAEWENWKGALSQATGASRAPNICNIEDSIYAAAYELSAAYASCPKAGYNVSQTPVLWDLDHMKASLSRWAAGCAKPICDGSVAANNYYCGNIEEFDQNISSSCQ